MLVFTISAGTGAGIGELMKPNQVTLPMNPTKGGTEIPGSVNSGSGDISRAFAHDNNKGEVPDDPSPSNIPTPNIPAPSSNEQLD